MTISQPDIAAWLDQEDARVADIVRRHGVMITMVGGGGCIHPECANKPSGVPFAYTTGLFGIAHPELVVVGLRTSASSFVLNTAARRVLDGERLVAGQELQMPQWDRRLFLESVPNPGEILFGANRHYQRPPEASVPALQLTYSDRRGAFPWEPTYTGSKRQQPRPGKWNAFDE
jgi:hypothetical protein